MRADDWQKSKNRVFDAGIGTHLLHTGNPRAVHLCRTANGECWSGRVGKMQVDLRKRADGRVPAGWVDGPSAGSPAAEAGRATGMRATPAPYLKALPAVTAALTASAASTATPSASSALSSSPAASAMLALPAVPTPPALSTRELTVTVKHRGVTKTLLDDVGFDVPNHALVAVIGPSGSGKSTLLRALTGSRPADSGEVRYAGRELCAEYSELRHRIGLVPQDDVLHAQLTVKSALRYAAALRFPSGTTEAERERRIDEVLAGLRLTEFADNKVSTLSGGQRKRVSVALELLTKPSVLFLDEPTSGLDPGMDRDVMRMLRGLTDEGRTVLVVTHSVAELEACDLLLVMAPGGGVAYYGPPQEALAFFECQSWADVFHAFSCRRGYDWAGMYRASSYYSQYCGASSVAAAIPRQRTRSTAEKCCAAAVDAHAIEDLPAPPSAAASRAGLPARLGSLLTRRTPAPAATPARSAPTRTEQRWGSQLRTLIRRYIAVIAADRGHLMLLAALPMIMGVLSLAIPASSGLVAAAAGTDGTPRTNTDAPTVLLVLAVGACLTGAANAVRELIKERGVYERERAAGLSRSAYVMSKAIVLGVITAAQTIVLSAVCILPRRLPAHGLVISGTPIPELMIATVLLGVTSMLLGLVVSAVVRTTEKTMPLLVLIAIVEVVFCGSLFPLFHSPALEQLAWLSPSRWAVAAEAATINLPAITGPPQGRTTTDPLWQHTLVQWGTDIGVLVLVGTLCLALVLRLLRRHESSLLRCC
ncbi:MAG: ATP-binding cassette domain-containing protein [Catenulisporales bacterium]|nr:ATP-binding cassette domain-containing protein [Catenulisporales bacterium]